MVRKEKILTEVKIKSKIVSSSKGKSTEVDAKFIITDTRMQASARVKSWGAVKVKIDFSIFERRFRQNWSFGY
jgi:hypothetical protein